MRPSLQPAQYSGRDPLTIGQNRRQVLREVANISSQAHLALSIQRLSGPHPTVDDRFPSLNEIGLQNRSVAVPWHGLGSLG
jgi:hypothetical protein